MTLKIFSNFVLRNRTCTREAGKVSDMPDGQELEIAYKEEEKELLGTLGANNTEKILIKKRAEQYWV